MKVDVMVCTYNSQATLDATLKSIVDNIPVQTLWILDNFSVDKTVEISKKYHAKIIQSHRGILDARAQGFHVVETELFVNVDSDIVLPKNWFNDMMKYWTNDLGCLWGITIEQHPLHNAYVTAMYRFRDPTTYNITHLPNMIAKKTVLGDLTVPPMLKQLSFGNDDAYIYHWMVNVKHAKVKTAPVKCKHYSFNLENKGYWCGAGERLTGFGKLQSYLLRLALAFPQGCYAALASRNARVIAYWVKFRFKCIIGFLKWSRYIDLKREGGKMI